MEMLSNVRNKREIFIRANISRNMINFITGKFLNLLIIDNFENFLNFYFFYYLFNLCLFRL